MKNDRYQSLLITLFLLICLLAPQAARAAEKHFLWRATADTSTVYLLGSIHVMKRDAYPLSTVIERAFDESDTLAVEADINNVGHGTLKMLRRAGFYDPNDSLANHITRNTYAYVAEEAARLGLPAPVLNRHKPWFLGITMSSMELMRSGYDMKYGIDKYFLTRASGRKKIVELESMEYQVDLLASLPESEQESFLLYTTKDLRSIGEQVDALMAAWRTGDADRIESILMRSIENDGRFRMVYKKIMTDRNRNMTKRISTYLKSGGRVFVVVGAGHMVGDAGIIELLRKEGYRVDQL